MSEQAPDEYDRLLQLAVQDVEHTDQVHAVIIAKHNEIVSMLAWHGVQHVWHPDRQQEQARRDAAVNDLVGIGYTTDSAEESVLGTLMVETSVASQIVRHMVQAEFIPTVGAPKLLKELRGYGMSAQWLAASAELLNCTEDTATEFDDEPIDQTLVTLYDTVYDVVVPADQQPLQTAAQRSQSSILTRTIVTGLVVAEQVPAMAATIEAHLYKLQRKGELSETQVNQLKHHLA